MPHREEIEILKKLLSKANAENKDLENKALGWERKRAKEVANLGKHVGS